MEVTRQAEALGGRVTGVDLSAPMDDAAFAEIHQAFLEHSVLIFPGQEITPEQHIAFTRRFGDLEIHVMAKFLLPDHPEVLVLSNDKKPNGDAVGIEDAGRYWHSDLSYLANPSMASLLYAIDVPPSRGDTMFASQYAAFDALSDDRKEELSKLRAVHHFGSRWLKEKGKAGVRPKMSAEELAKTPPVDHPIIRTHPETGKKTIYVGGFCTGVVGMEEDEGAAFVDELSDYASSEPFRYLHQWTAGDLVMWDNRCTMHCASDYDPQYRRHMNRTTLKGDAPF